MIELKSEHLKNDLANLGCLTNDLFKQAWEFSTDGLCVLNENHIIVEANSTFCKIFNISIDGIKNTELGIAQSNQRIFDLEVRKIFNLENLTLKTSRSAIVNSGKRVLLHHFLHKTTDSANGSFYFWIVKDKTDYMEMKKALETEIEDFRITLKSVGDGLITTDIAGKVININPEAEKLTGWKKAYISGKTLDQIFVIVDEATGIDMNT